MYFKKVFTENLEEYALKFDKVDAVAGAGCGTYCPDVVYAFNPGGGCCHDHDLFFFKDIQP